MADSNAQSNYAWANEVLRTRYPSWIGIDSVIEQALADHVPARAVVLDVGCGRNSPLRDLVSRTSMSIGTDVDAEEVRANRDLSALVVSDGASLAFADDTFDLLLSKTAIEHMSAPEQFFSGVYRVLRPGGVFVWATSNLRSLPILVSWLTPLGLHRWVYRRVFGQSLAIEQFPVRYRANTPRTVERQLTALGFERIALRTTSWPCYFAFSRPLFRAMLPVHRWLDRAGMQLLQVHLIGVYRKPLTAPPSR